MEKVFIKDGIINYYGEGEEIEILSEDKRKMEFEGYTYLDGEFIAPLPIEKSNQEKLLEVENKLLELSGKITGLKQLIENGLNTDDDLVTLENLSLEAKDLAEQRKILKSNI